MSEKRFIIRVYAIIINDKHEVLLSDEFFFNSYMTKFPGGGLEWGEGIMDCVKREAIEEFGQEIEIIEHFYTTDYFQKALFYEDTQLICVYYKVKFKGEISFKISDKPFDFEELKEGSQSFRWKSLKELGPDDMTFPIDKVVAKLLAELK
jgi:ADP-ribose pyrophosphatase YjhB (NUDIX family)